MAKRITYFVVLLTGLAFIAVAHVYSPSNYVPNGVEMRAYVTYAYDGGDNGSSYTSVLIQDEDYPEYYKKPLQCRSTHLPRLKEIR